MSTNYIGLVDGLFVNKAFHIIQFGCCKHCTRTNGALNDWTVGSKQKLYVNEEFGKGVFSAPFALYCFAGRIVEMAGVTNAYHPIVTWMGCPTVSAVDGQSNMQI